MKLMKKHLFFVLCTLLIIPLAVGDLDVSIAKYDPLPASAGEFVDVWFKIENTGNNAKTQNNVVIIVEPKDGLELTGGEPSTKSIGTFDIGVQNIKYRLKVKEDALEGENRIDVSLLQNGNGPKKELFIDVINEQANIQVGDIVSSPTKIRPDLNDVKFDVTLLNLGQGSAKATKVKLIDLPTGISGSSSYSDISLLGDIGVDESAVATFYLDIDENVAPGKYSSNIEVSYKTSLDGNPQIKETILPVDINIQKVALYEITKIEFTPQELEPGMSNVEMKVSIKNVGQEEGESIRLKAFSKSEQPFTFDVSSTFVAPRLDAGESAQAILTFDIDKDAKLQEYLLDVEIKNIIEEDTIIYEDKISVPVLAQKSSSAPSYVGFGVVIALIYIAYRYISHRKKNKRKRELQQAKDHYGESYLHKLSSHKDHKRRK